MQRPPYPPTPRQRSDSQWVAIALIAFLACALVGVGGYAWGLRQARVRVTHELDLGLPNSTPAPRPMFDPNAKVVLNQWSVHPYPKAYRRSRGDLTSLLICNVTVTNIGRGRVYAVGKLFKMTSSDNRVYDDSDWNPISLDPDVAAQTFGRPVSWINGELLPGGSTTGDVLFEVRGKPSPAQVGMRSY